MKKWMGLILVPLMVVAAMAQAESKTAKASMADTVSAVVDVLEKQGLPFDMKAARQAAVDAIVETADPLGHVMTAEDAKWMENQHKGVFTEVNIRVAVSNGVVKIVEVVPGSSAEKEGLKVGEVVEEIDKGSVAGFSLSEIGEFLRGPANEMVTLKVKNEAGESRIVEVRRGLSTASAIRISEEWPANMCYLKLNGLYADSSRELVPLLRGWAAAGREGVILDLRDAGGADVDSVVAVASLFAPLGAMLFSFRDPANQDISVHKAAVGAVMDMPAMVLVDERTTGAAEVLAAALAGSVRGAMLIGSTTAADPLVREKVPLPDGEQLYITTRRLVVADGTTYDGREGVHPDVVVDAGLAAPVEYEPEPAAGKEYVSDEMKEHRLLRQRVRGDATLQRAVDVLLGLKALDIRGTGRSDNSTP